MDSASLATNPSSSSSSSYCSHFTRLSKHNSPNPRWIQLKRKKENERKLLFKSLKSSTRNPSSSVSWSAVTETPVGTYELAAGKLESLVSEFKSLSEPIDRVKRLLHYASLLPPLEESARVASNRVTGCTAEVWLDARMDEFGRMRFRADSDSEITKGFCSCLIWMLDGASPEEVLKLRTEDMAEMNVGVAGRAHSRVNTWHNVLISMHKRTKALIAETEAGIQRPLYYSFSDQGDF